MTIDARDPNNVKGINRNQESPPKTQRGKPGKRKTSRAPPIPGSPKRKSAEKLAEAAKRVAVLAAIRSKPDPETRLREEATLTHALFDAESVSLEPDVAATCWVGYRRMSPIVRTEEFASDYARIYRALEEERKERPLPDSRPLEPDLMSNSANEIAALYRARADADALGVPYPVYLEVLMRAAVEKDKWGRPPRPNQLYGKLEAPRLRGRPSIVDVATGLARLAGNPTFAAVNYRGDPDQDEALRLVQRVVEHSKAPSVTLSAYFKLGLVSETQARDLFRTQVVDEATLTPADPTVTPSNPPTFRKGCLGFQPKLLKPLCLQCPMCDACGQATTFARNKLIQHTGTDNPRVAKEKRQSAARSKKYRDKQRAEAAVLRAEAIKKRKADIAAATGLDKLRMMIADERVRIARMMLEKRRDGPVGLHTSLDADANDDGEWGWKA